MSTQPHLEILARRHFLRDMTRCMSGGLIASGGLTTTGLVSLMSVTGCTSSSSNPAPANRRRVTRPNILLILAETNSDQHFTAAPFLAQNGMRFTHAYGMGETPSAQMNAVLTGMHPAQSRAINSKNETLPRILKSSGYQTAFVGDWPFETRPANAGFQIHIPNIESKRWLETESAKLLDYMQHDQRPYLLCLRPRPNQALKRLLEQVANSPQASRTLTLCLVSAKRRANQFLESDVRSGLLVQWPNEIKANSECNVPVTAMDIFPTLLDAAGIRIRKDRHDSDSFHASNSFRASNSFHDSNSFRANFNGLSRPQRQNLVWWNPNRPTYGAIRIGYFKYIRLPGRETLYNVKNDPGETQDISALHPQLTRQLALKLDAAIAAF